MKMGNFLKTGIVTLAMVFATSVMTAPAFSDDRSRPRKGPPNDNRHHAEMTDHHHKKQHKPPPHKKHHDDRHDRRNDHHKPPPPQHRHNDDHGHKHRDDRRHNDHNNRHNDWHNDRHHNNHRRDDHRRDDHRHYDDWHTPKHRHRYNHHTHNSPLIIITDPRTPVTCFQSSGHPINTIYCTNLITEWIRAGEFTGLLDGRFENSNQLTPCVDPNGYFIDDNPLCRRIIGDERHRLREWQQWGGQQQGSDLNDLTRALDQLLPK